MTNGDKIRSMSNEELAEIVGLGMQCWVCPWNNADKCIGGESCQDACFEYLNQEVSE